MKTKFAVSCVLWGILLVLLSASGYAKDESAAYTIEGIMYSKDNPMVMIKGNVYHLNESVCGGMIIGITSDEVTIKFQDAERKFRMGSKIELGNLADSREAQEAAASPRILGQNGKQQEQEGAIFTKPSGWIADPVKTKRGKCFYTNSDPAQRLIILLRTIQSPNQTAYEWAIDESRGIMAKARKVTQPQSVTIGNSSWVVLEWEDPYGVQTGSVSSKGQQYYSKKDSKYTLVEVSVMGPKIILDSPDSAARKEIYDFISSIRIGTKSEAVKENLPWKSLGLYNGSTDAIILSNTAYRYFSERQFDKAIELYEEALAKAQDNNLKAMIYLGLSSSYLEKGIAPYLKEKNDSFYKKSLEYADQCLILAPKEWKALGNKGTVYMNTGDYKQADFFYSEAEKYVDQNSPYYKQLILQHVAIKAAMKLKSEN